MNAPKAVMACDGGQKVRLSGCSFLYLNGMLSLNSVVAYTISEVRLFSSVYSVKCYMIEGRSRQASDSNLDSKH